MRETQLKLVYSKGRMCWPPSLLASILGKGEAPGTSGPNVHKAPSLSQSLTSYCFVHSACLTSYSTGTSFHGRQHNQRQSQLGNQNWDEVSFPSWRLKIPVKLSYWPNLSHELSPLNQSLWPRAYDSMTGYPAQGATWPSMWPVGVDLLSKGGVR